MTKEEFVALYRHEFAGVALDGLNMGRAGGDALALWVRAIFLKIDRKLGEMYDRLKPTPHPQPPMAAKAK